MGPDFGLSILLPALLISSVTVWLAAREEQALGRHQQAQATNCSKPI
jgi:hypothetical protein